MASTSLTRTTGTPTLGTKCTVSFWVKIDEVPAGSGTDRWLFGEYGNNNNHSYLYLRNSSAIGWYENDGSGTVASIITNRLCRDLNGWYHFMIVYDTTLSTQADRFKLYINGERETSWNTNTNSIAQNYEPRINRTGRSYYIGGSPHVTKFGGSMSHYHHVDGSALAPTVFGETDSTTGEWKIKASPSFTVGNNGFTILKDGNTITDQSANSNNFTVASGTLTKTEDCPSNVFATMNPLDNFYASSTFSNGNNTIVTNNSNYTWNTGTLGMTSGKFYWEVKYSANSTGSYYNLIGIADRPTNNSQDPLGRQTDCSNYGYYGATGGVYAKSTSATTFGNTYTVGDIVGVAVDLDNSKLYFSKNGTWQNSGVPTSGSTGTGAISIDAISSTTTGVYFPASGDWGSSQYATNQHNFGNGYFGTTAVSSAGTNASGIGIFEYDVPAGYTALSTKGLNE